MREYVEAYCQIVDNNNNQWGRVSEKKKENRYCAIVDALFPDPPRVPDPALRANAGEPPGAVHPQQAHGAGEAR